MGSNVLLGHDGTTPVYLRYDRRTAHVAILGKSRFGKTTLLEHLVLQDMRDGTAAIVIDAHGDLTKRLISLAPSNARDKLVLVEANDDHPFGLNLYECPVAATAEVITTTVGNVVGIFHKLMGVEGGGLLPVIDSGLRNTARVLIANGLTMAEIPQLYLDSTFRHAALAKVTNPGVHQYWQEYESSTRQRQQERRDPVLNKVGRFLEDDLIRLMISQTRTTVPFKEAMKEGGTLILNLAGLDRESIAFLGMVFLSVLSNLIHQRSVSDAPRSRVHLYLDEYGRFATPTTQQLLEEGGKYELGVTIAHQNLAQTPQREALNVESFIVFQLSPDDAETVAPVFAKPPPSVRVRAGISQTPLKSLANAQPHPDPEVRSAVRSLEGGLDRLIDDARAATRSDLPISTTFEDPTTGRQRTASHPGLYIEGDVINNALAEFDRLLVSVMEHGIQPEAHTEPLVSIMSDLALGACNTSYFNWALRPSEALPDREEHVELLHLLTSFVRRCLYDVQTGLPPQRSALARFSSLEKAMAEYDPHWSGGPHPDSYAQLLFYFISVLKIYTVLAQDPIFLAFGPQGEHQRTYADMQAEAAMEIRNLPRYVAYCKLFDPEEKPHG
ncbi:DUF87 domain-containing protein [Streptomyces sp. NPDC052101]|uniref:helicase HerA domain-containing protein n=1 Tax=Streptomyces sp. NPDC052101 TaxID=3155763 RepID=UPI00341AC0A0